MSEPTKNRMNCQLQGEGQGMSDTDRGRGKTEVGIRPTAFDFEHMIESVDTSCSRFESLRTVQLNLGNRCNLTCSHCHVEASPSGEKVMGKEVIDAVLAFLRKSQGITLDITGGCPEMNPHFRYLIEQTDHLDLCRIVRTNLVITREPGMEWLPEFYRDHGLGLVASLPCFTRDNVDRQRGTGVFEQSIAALQLLNGLGYGESPELTLVYNPGEAVLPGPQNVLEAMYREELLNGYHISFTRLFTLTNIPIGRFRNRLMESDALEGYLQTLVECFNPEAARAIMCRSLISIDWKGLLYNCDFNQAAGLPIRDAQGTPCTIHGLDRVLLEGIDPVFGPHCFGCTAGEGSGCFGQQPADQTLCLETA